MNVTFHGAVREVTGSAHLLTNGKDRILLDCGMFQGPKSLKALNYDDFPFHPRHDADGILVQFGVLAQGQFDVFGDAE